MNILIFMRSSVAVDQFIWDKEGNIPILSFLHGLLHFNPRPICYLCYKAFSSFPVLPQKAGVFFTWMLVQTVVMNVGNVM
jgi:hypothetical protein